MIVLEGEGLGTICPELSSEAAGMDILHGAGTELDCAWREVLGLFLDVVEGSKDFIPTWEALTSQPGTEITANEKMHREKHVGSSSSSALDVARLRHH